MANELEADWAEFRRHKFPGVRIKDRKESIHFSQRVHLMNQKANVPIILCRVIGGAVWFIPTIIIGMQRGAFGAFLYFCAATLPVGLFIWLAYMIFRDRISLNIYPGKVIIKEGRRAITIANDDIQNIDMRGSGRTFSVYVWNKKIPVLTMSQDAEHRAISLREGIMLAIQIVNHFEVVSGPQTQTAARGKTFDE
jgi:hypothetical protein